MEKKIILTTLILDQENQVYGTINSEFNKKFNFEKGSVAMVKLQVKKY